MDTFKIKNGHFTAGFDKKSLHRDWTSEFGSFSKALYGFISGDLEDPGTCRGEFLLLQFDATYGELKVARDPLGVIPVYYAWVDEKFYVSNSISELTKKLPKLTPNADYFDRLRRQDFSNQQNSPYLEISRLPAWHFLSLTSESFDVFRYGNIASLKKAPPQKESLQEVLAGSLKTRAQGHDKTALLLSGGFDSSSLHFLAENLNLNLESFCIDFSNFPAKEENGLRTLEVFSKRKTHRLSFDEYQPQMPRSEAWPILKLYSPTHAMLAPLLEKARNAGASVIFTGLGGDDVFSPPGSHFLWQNRFRPTRWLQFEPGEFKIAVKGLLTHFLRRILPLDVLKFLNKKHENYKKLKLNLFQVALTERFELGGAYPYGMETEQEYAQHLGLRMSYPLLDLNIVQWVFQNSDSDFASWNTAKPQFRESMKGLVPEDIRQVRSEQDPAPELTSLFPEILDSNASPAQKTELIINEYKRKVYDSAENTKNKEKDSRPT